MSVTPEENLQELLSAYPAAIQLAVPSSILRAILANRGANPLVAPLRAALEPVRGPLEAWQHSFGWAEEDEARLANAELVAVRVMAMLSTLTALLEAEEKRTGSAR